MCFETVAREGLPDYEWPLSDSIAEVTVLKVVEAEVFTRYIQRLEGAAIA